MNKKAIEPFTISILIVGLLVASISFINYEGKLENKNYVGDISTNITYNLESNNPNCNIQEIKIEKTNLRLFENLQDAENQGFKLSEICN